LYVMILAAGMAVPGIGPEKVSGEMREPRLDLRGEWKGTYGAKDGETASGRLGGGVLTLEKERMRGQTLG
jgi:hypothetical protein